MVVNLHVTERCNYRCTYCFGQWGLAEAREPETGIFGDTGRAIDVIQQLWLLFSPDRAVRFNFVGGEPALLANLPELVSEAKNLGARTSYVTNGLMLRRFRPEWTAHHIDLLGVSIDSPHAATNRTVGRIGRNGVAFDPAAIVAALDAVRAIGTSTAVKVNTVVSAWNAHEDFSSLIGAISPDRWKVLKMLPVYTSDGATTDERFHEFIDRHAAFQSVIVSEDNDQMSRSYAMVDPNSRFFWYDGDVEQGYSYSAPIAEVGADVAWKSAGCDLDKFEARYPTPV